MRDSYSLEATSKFRFPVPSIISQASFPILTNDVPELCVVSPLRSGKKLNSVLSQGPVLVPSSQRCTAQFLEMSLSITLNFKPKPETEFLTCLPDYKAGASWMIKTAAGNILKASWSLRQLNICLNPLPSHPPAPQFQSKSREKVNTGVHTVLPWPGRASLSCKKAHLGRWGHVGTETWRLD